MRKQSGGKKTLSRETQLGKGSQKCAVQPSGAKKKRKKKKERIFTKLFHIKSNLNVHKIDRMTLA